MEAKEYRAGLVLWPDESGLETEWTGATVVWKGIRLSRWQEKKGYLEKKKKRFDAELCANFSCLRGSY